MEEKKKKDPDQPAHLGSLIGTVLCCPDHVIMYCICIYPKYLDPLTLYHICPKISVIILCLLDVFKNCWMRLHSCS